MRLLLELARHFSMRDGDDLVLLEAVDALSEGSKARLPRLKLRSCGLVQV